MAWKHQNQKAVRDYLLRKLSDADQQNIELRLLSDDSYADELEIAEDDLVDEYVNGELSKRDRRRFEQDFLTTPERITKLQSAQTLKRYFDKLPSDPHYAPGRFERVVNWVTHFRISSPIPAVITLLVVAVFGLAAWRWWFYQSNLEKALVALNNAYSQERPIEARISNLDYAPFIPRRGNDSERVNALEKTRAEVLLLEVEKERRDAASYHALGQLFLLQKDYNRTIEYLLQAAKANPTNPQILADLGAAYLERGKSELDAGQADNGGKALEDVGRSLEYTKQALELNPNLLPALFNRGLIHSYQGLYADAESDWRVYLEKDPNSQWAVDARQNLKLLEEKKNRKSQNIEDLRESFLLAYRSGDDSAAWDLYRRNHVPSGNLVTAVLVDSFLSDNSGSQTNENLRALDYLGQLERRKANDAYTSNLAQVYTTATAQTRSLLFQARQQVTKGYELSRQSMIGEAATLFEQASITFKSVGDLPEAIAAENAMANGAAVQPNLTRGQELLERIIPACETNRYKWLLADALTQRAHIKTNLNNYSEAIDDGSRGLQLFEQLNDSRSTLGSLKQMAGLYLFLNDNQTSLSFLRRAMAIAQEEQISATDLWGLHITASLNFNALKLYRTALDYQSEALKLLLALPKPFPLYLSRSYQYIGLTYGSLRRFELAFENVRKAYEVGRPLAAERNGKNIMAYASLNLGNLYRVAGDESSALAAYEESSRLYEQIDFAHYSYAAHKGKFLAYLAQDNDALAWQELQIVLGLFDEYREKIQEERQKSSFFDREQDTYDLAIEFAYFQLNDKYRAFEYSETCRARNLRDLMQHGAEVTHGASGLDLRSSNSANTNTALPLTPGEIQQQLPERVQVIQASVLEKKLLLLYITRTEIFPKVVEIESAKLADLVSTALAKIRNRDEADTATSLRSLYEVLVQPIREKLDRQKVICFVPDKTLHYLPFAALISPDSGRYLIQDYRVMTSPSTTILIESTSKAAALARIKDERLLAVGNPTFDRTSEPNLPGLPDTEYEVKEISSSYPSHRVLPRSQATRNSVVNELARSQVAHFAGHYVIDPLSQLSSRLLLSTEPGNGAHAQVSGLKAADIYQMRLARTKLVILSACQTGIEQQFGGEGAIGFARSFLVAGVPVVVASLWPVESEATSELMIAFHRFRRSNHLSTTEALMHAQQEMISSEKYHSPFYWAGFTVIGGYSEF